MDHVDYQHAIATYFVYSATGANFLDPINFYTGFIYQLCISGNPMTNFPIDTNPSCGGTIFCAECPTGPSECLVECEWDQWVDYTNPGNPVCSDCRADCGHCYRGVNCNRCEDDECKTCPGFEMPCTECIANATGAPDCECIDPNIYKPADH